jgi:hypothetical protein
VRTITLAGLVAATLVAGLGIIGSADPADTARAATPAAATLGPLSGGGSPVSQDDQAISCGTPTACLAVGTTSGATAEASAVALEGTRWKTVPVPVPKKGQIAYSLDAVSCKTAAYCLVAGSYESNQDDSTVLYLLTWNGTSLTLIPAPPVPRGHTLATIDAVSCVAVRSCVLFGTADNAYVNGVELAWTWNGSKWAAKGTAFPAGVQNPSVSGADCFSLTSCEVIGRYGMYLPGGPMFAAWNGRKFTLQRAAVSADIALNGTLRGISCVSPRRCAALGWVSTYGFLAVWNGKTWRATTWSGPEYHDFGLGGVSCRTADSCLAVGYNTTYKVQTGGAVSLIWNGRKWLNAGVPGVGPGLTTYFYGVSCPKPDRCVAIGLYTNWANGRIWTLAGYWNGRSWKLTGV